ncbi:S-Ena type endospore appendage [Cytobacillus sp. IB215665]|uniref:S-Ena type endospore appendage n=1 Tax=Cytobacillus sp. IB215665 TaxID=3097357 RepID=UPI002A17A331|nr:S-Ena type endospore appendage [Cytobacillus sp. IB215665]MDX8366945.1 S-Ena type endospore appendage [Cytobacillus sp. IB215665]
MGEVHVNPSCDKGSGCDKTITTDRFCCQFTVDKEEKSEPTILYKTLGCASVTACFKIENQSDQESIIIMIDGDESHTITVLPCSCITGVVNGLKEVSAILDKYSTSIGCGKIDIKLFYDIHD